MELIADGLFHLEWHNRYLIARMLEYMYGWIYSSDDSYSTGDEYRAIIIIIISKL